MARWYARFDAGNETALDNTNGTGGYFTKLRFGAFAGESAGAASGAKLRAGLIDSRSALSADAYADISAVNRDGAAGTYFPPNTSPGPFSTNFSTYASWSNGYTPNGTQLPGIKTPTTNVYGVADSVNYSLRPTGSVNYTDGNLTALSPADDIGVSYTTYNDASTAVRAVIEKIETTLGVAQTPYTRTGNDASRTIHSVYHDPNLNYFAWDDFTPGTFQGKVSHSIGPNAPTGCPLTMSLGDPVSIDLEIYVNVAQFSPFQYPNDGNYDAEIGFTVELRESSSVGTLLARLQLGGPNDVSPYANGGPLQIGDYVTGTGPVGNRGSSNSTWQWNLSGPNYNGQLKWTIPVTAGEYSLASYGIIHDVIITTHTSQGSCFNFPSDSCSNYSMFQITAGASS